MPGPAAEAEEVAQALAYKAILAASTSWVAPEEVEAQRVAVEAADGPHKAVAAPSLWSSMVAPFPPL